MQMYGVRDCRVQTSILDQKSSGVYLKKEVALSRGSLLQPIAVFAPRSQPLWTLSSVQIAVVGGGGGGIRGEPGHPDPEIRGSWSEKKNSFFSPLV